MQKHIAATLSRVGLLLGFLAYSAYGGEITGRLTFDDGRPALGEVAVGVITDVHSPYAAALVDVMKTRRKVITDADGGYRITNVPEGINVFVIASAFQAVAPPRTQVVNLHSGENLTNVNFVFPAAPPQEIKLQGIVTVNGQPPSQEIAGIITVVKTDFSIASIEIWGIPEGQYAFKDLPPGEYRVRAGSKQPDSTVVTTTTTVIIPAIGAVTLNLNIQTQ